MRIRCIILQTIPIMQAGDLILVDAGGEYNNFVSDITRTWPISGRFVILRSSFSILSLSLFPCRFTKAQKEVYEAVLYIQQKLLGDARRGRV